MKEWWTTLVADGLWVILGTKFRKFPSIVWTKLRTDPKEYLLYPKVIVLNLKSNLFYIFPFHIRFWSGCLVNNTVAAIIIKFQHIKTIQFTPENLTGLKFMHCGHLQHLLWDNKRNVAKRCPYGVERWITSSMFKAWILE